MIQKERHPCSRTGRDSTEDMQDQAITQGLRGHWCGAQVVAARMEVSTQVKQELGMQKEQEWMDDWKRG